MKYKEIYISSKSLSNFIHLASIHNSAYISVGKIIIKDMPFAYCTVVNMNINTLYKLNTLLKALLYLQVSSWIYKYEYYNEISNISDEFKNVFIV